MSYHQIEKIVKQTGEIKFEVIDFLFATKIKFN